MGKRFRAILITLFVAALLGVIWMVSRKPEPSYHGKRLSQYVEDMSTRFPSNINAPEVADVYQMGPDAIPYLRRILRQKNSFRTRALTFLHEKLPASLSKHLPAAPNKDRLRDTAVFAADCLAAFGSTARPAVPDLYDRFDEVMTINSAYYAVSQIGPAPEDLPRLYSMLMSTNWGAPLYAADLIARIGVTNAQILGALTNFALTGKPDIRQRSIYALGTLGDKARPAIPVLTHNLDDPDSLMRISSATALWRIQGNSNSAAAFMTRELEHEITNGSPSSTVMNAFGNHEVVLLLTTQALKSCGSEAVAAIPSLREIENADNFMLVRLSAADALWSIAHDTTNLDRICLDGMDYFDTGDQDYAAEMMARVCLEQHEPRAPLYQMYHSTNHTAQFYAARALWKLEGQPDSRLPFLIHALKDHVSGYENVHLRIMAAETLGEMGTNALPAMPDLTIALQDSEAPVRAAAKKAIAQINAARGIKTSAK